MKHLVVADNCSSEKDLLGTEFGTESSAFSLPKDKRNEKIKKKICLLQRSKFSILKNHINVRVLCLGIVVNHLWYILSCITLITVTES